MDGDITTADIEAAMQGSAEPDSSVPSDDTAQPDAATTLPAGSPESPQPRTAEPPQEKWPQILDNARKKAADEAWAGYEPLRGIPAAQVSEMVSWWQKAAQNPDEFLTNTFLEHRDPMALIDALVTKVQQHPTHGQSFKSFIGKRLAAMRNQQPETEPPSPFVPQPDGSVAFDPAAYAQREEWIKRQAIASMSGEIAPIKQLIEQQKQQQAAAEQQRSVDTFADNATKDFLTWPGMEDEATRKQVVLDFYERTKHHSLNDDQLKYELAMAHQRVTYPTLSKRERERAVHDINQTAAAGSINPARTSTQAPKSVDQMSLRESIEAAMAGQLS